MEPLRIQTHDNGILIITLNRPDQRNALSIALMQALTKALKKAQKARVIILKGDGPVFCSGLDLHEANNPKLMHKSAKAIADLLKTLYEAPQVTIAAVHGAAIAGGAGIASACDLVIAAEGSRFGYPEVKRGMVASLVMGLLQQQIPEHAAKELLLLGELISTERALALGLINKVVPAAALQDEALNVAKLALQGAPGAIKNTKLMWNQLKGFQKSFKMVKASHTKMRKSPEAKEGVKAFIEKRKPRWQP